MGTFRKFLRFLKIFIGGLLGLTVILYLLLVAINWRDQPPSDLVLKTTELLENQVQIPDDENAYIYLLGFSSPHDLDPISLGKERSAWLKKAAANSDFEHSDYPHDDYDVSFKLSEDITKFSDSCKNIDNNCLTALENIKEKTTRWLNEEQWIIDRYSTFINLNEFQEFLPYDVKTPLAPYSNTLEGQKLYFAEAWIHANEGNIKLASEMLDRDLRFWRMILSKSDLLITKMIATAAIRKHFKFGNLILRQVNQNGIADATPTSWKTPISLEERSLQRCFVGEWLFVDHIVKSIEKDRIENLTGEEDPTFWTRVMWKFTKPVWKPQATSNRHYENLMALAELFDTDYGELPDAIDRSQEFIESRTNTFWHPYNFVGNILTSIALPAFDDYAVRISDLEGIRRAALITNDLRIKGIVEEDIESKLVEHSIREPYWNDPFGWDPESKSVLFYGLVTGKHKQHRMIY